MSGSQNWSWPWWPSSKFVLSRLKQIIKLNSVYSLFICYPKLCRFYVFRTDLYCVTPLSSLVEWKFRFQQRTNYWKFQNSTKKIVLYPHHFSPQSTYIKSSMKYRFFSAQKFNRLLAFFQAESWSFQ